MTKTKKTDKERFDEKQKKVRASMDFYKSLSRSKSTPNIKRKGKTMSTIISDQSDWAFLSCMIGKPRGAKKDYEIQVLCKTEIKKLDLLFPAYCGIMGVVEVLEHKPLAAGDWSNHPGDPPGHYKLLVRDVDIFTAAKLDPDNFAGKANKEKEKQDEAAKQKIEDAKPSFRKKKKRVK